MPAPKDPIKYAEFCKNVSKSLMGNTRTLGFHPSEETRKKMSESHIGLFSGENHPLYASHASEKTKEKMSNSHKGLFAGEKHPMYGKHQSEESNKKRSATLKGKRSGKKHHNWQGGKSFEPYCEKFNAEFKERVRVFFDYTCQMCGHVWQKGERKLSVHHVNYNKNACCDPLIKPIFVPVCSGKCHLITNQDREHWEQHFIELIMTKYGGQCYLPKKGGKQ